MVCYIDKGRQFKIWYVTLTKGGNSRYEEEFEDIKGQSVYLRTKTNKQTNKKTHNGQNESTKG